MDQLRLIIDLPQSGAWNMAVDEALLESAADGNIATLRLYTWSEPTLSLGYFQAAAERETHAASHNCALVRRASGGGAILHDRELTYSIALPEKSGLAAAAKRLYDVCHATLIAVLAELGVATNLHGPSCEVASDPDTQAAEPFLCFQRRTCFDIVSGPAKIVGSAQRRRRGGILQHGSVLLAQSPFAPELPGILEVSGRALTANAIAKLWPPRLAGELSYSLVSGELSTAERTRAAELQEKRFSANDWILRR